MDWESGTLAKSNALAFSAATFSAVHTDHMNSLEGLEVEDHGALHEAMMDLFDNAT